MKDYSKDLNNYREFLGSLPLNVYREKYRKIKWVEQDLHPLLFPVASIFENYWEKQNFLHFEVWFDKFWEELSRREETTKKLSNFKGLVYAHRKFYENKINNDLDKTFYLGFKARMNRTWIAILTQLDFCYAFVYVCNKQNKSLNLECSAELDAKGIDAKVGNAKFQIGKISQRRVARVKERLITIPYAVFNIEEFKRKSKSPRVSPNNRRKYERSLETFYKYFVLLKNGFVVFSEYYLNTIMKNIHSIENLKRTSKQISLELAGEV